MRAYFSDSAVHTLGSTSLRESEERYRELVMTSIDGVISVNSRMEVILWNPAAERIFGYTEKEMLGQSLMKIVPQSFRAAKENGFAEFEKTCSGPLLRQVVQLYGLRKDGTEVPIEISVSSRKDGDSYVATAIVRDITERKRAEEELRDREERYRSLFDLSVDAVFLETLDGDIIDCNATACEMLGYTREELVGLNVADIVSDEVKEILPNITIVRLNYRINSVG